MGLTETVLVLKVRGHDEAAASMGQSLVDLEESQRVLVFISFVRFGRFDLFLLVRGKMLGVQVYV